MNLSEAKEGEEYIVKGILTEDEELNAFLFSLGCYSFHFMQSKNHLSFSI